jgi:hypothetical protein
MMRKATASAYCDLTSADFEREVAAGRLPLGIRLGKEEHWSRDQLDGSLDTMLGIGGARNWREECPGLALPRKRKYQDHVKVVRSKGHTYHYFDTGRKNAAGVKVYARLPDPAISTATAPSMQPIWPGGVASRRLRRS